MVDYLAWQQATKNPLESAMTGYQQGLQQKQVGEDRGMMLEDRAANKAKVEAQSKRVEQMQNDMFDLSQNKTASAKDYAGMMLKYPEMAKVLSEPMELMSDAQKDNQQKTALNIFAALDSGQPDIAKEIAERNLEAAKNSGNQETIDASKMILQLIEQDPDSAKAVAGYLLANSMGEDKFASTLKELRPDAEEGAKRDKVSVNDWRKTAQETLNIGVGKMGEMDFSGIMGDVSSAVQERAIELYNSDPSLSHVSAVRIAVNELWLKSGMRKLKNSKLISKKEFAKTWQKVMSEKINVKELKRNKSARKPVTEEVKEVKEDPKDPAGLGKFFGL